MNNIMTMDRADIIRGIIKSKGFKIDANDDTDLVFNYWDKDIEIMIYNLEMDSE